MSSLSLYAFLATIAFGHDGMNDSEFVDRIIGNGSHELDSSPLEGQVIIMQEEAPNGAHYLQFSQCTNQASESCYTQGSVMAAQTYVCTHSLRDQCSHNHIHKGAEELIRTKMTSWPYGTMNRLNQHSPRQPLVQINSLLCIQQSHLANKAVNRVVSKKLILFALKTPSHAIKRRVNFMRRTK